MRTVFIQNKEEIEAVIRSCKTCFLGMADENGQPYVLPMNFGYQDDEIILHSAQEGRLISVLKKNPKVCVTFCHGEELVWQNEHVACSYRVKSTSVVAEGTIRFVDDFDEKVKYLHLTMKQYTSATFQFGAPAVRNVNIMVVKVDNITAKEFGVDPNSPKFR